MEGKVKWFNSRKGFGFIQGDDGKDYFVHYTELPKGIFLRENDQVNFEAADTDKGKQAKKVVLTKKASESGESGSQESPADEGQEEAYNEEDI